MYIVDARTTNVMQTKVMNQMNCECEHHLPHEMNTDFVQTFLSSKQFVQTTVSIAMAIKTVDTITNIYTRNQNFFNWFAIIRLV